MFDYHMHSAVSEDGRSTGAEMAAKAAQMGLKEICFTDHIDDIPDPNKADWTFETSDYNAAYDHLAFDDLKIKKGIEFGLLPDNRDRLPRELQRRPFDFVIGSIHFAQNVDVYDAVFWDGRTVAETEATFLKETLECVRIHDDFDVLGHLTVLGKVRYTPHNRPMAYFDHADIVDEIFRVLIQKGKGLEVNTSGLTRCGAFLPTADYLHRFKELGGEIVTVGSDAHSYHRVGHGCADACTMVNHIFGHVCTFSDRKPEFHKL